MNKKIFISYWITATVVVMAFNWASGKYNTEKAVYAIATELKSSTARFLSDVTNSIRNDLLIQNWRGVRHRLKQLKDKQLFSDYAIHQADQLVEKSRNFLENQADPQFYKTTTPIYFDNAPSKWGDIIYLTQLPGIMVIKNNLKTRLVWGTILIGVILGLVFASSFWLIWRSSVNLVPILEKALRNEGTSAESKITKLLWQNLIDLFKTTITQYQVWQGKVQQSEKLATIGSAASLISHDIRRPFNNLKTFLELLPDHIQDQKYIENTSRSIMDSVSSVGIMLDEMMAFSSQRAVTITKINLLALFDSAFTELFQTKKTLPIQIKYAIFKDLEINVDQQKIERVIHNIIGNAVEAIGEGGLIWVNTTIKDRQLIIVIGDKGPAIPAENLNNLFEPFYTYGKRGGTGLGLAISRQMVEDHGGELAVRNTDMGPEFVISLPWEDVPTGCAMTHKTFSVGDLFQPNSMAPLESEFEYEKTSSKTLADLFPKIKEILVVDDDQIQREYLTTVLQQAFPTATIRDCQNHEAAESAAFEHLLDLVITDYDLKEPGKNGVQVIATIKKYLPDAIVILTSSQTIAQLEAQEVINVPFLPKPISTEALTQVLVAVRKVRK